ncbi:nucleotide exchange factor GrpE [Amycolatopsis alba]|uniref:nucleotide exchange factor GrpE n=1 Tax=Amycolatopsis alba TaxID=76020 RepID=UPI0003A25BB3|nr:nucleotide exchange factor GrpE [Amycolatopsis alba]
MSDAGTDGVAEGAADDAEEAPSGVAEHETADLARLADVVSRLGTEIEAHHARAAARERVIDRLHAEVERLRAGEQGILLRPVITDLQNLRADLLRQVRTLPAELSGERVAQLLESFALTTELALERCGTEPFRPETGDKFSPREHRAVKVVAASSAGEDGTIAEVVADGYRDLANDRVATAAKVHVRRWEPSADQVGGAEEAGKANENELEGSMDV